MTALDCQISNRGLDWRDYVHLKIDYLILINVNLLKLCQRMKIKMPNRYTEIFQIEMIIRISLKYHRGKECGPYYMAH